MAKIRWSVTAAGDSILYAVSFVDRLVESVERLTSTPLAGRKVPEFGQEDLREIIFRGYRVIYRVSGNTLSILRVVHGARNLEGLLPGELGHLE